LSRIRHTVSDKTLASLSIPDDQVIEALETTGRGWVVELDGVIVAFTIGDALTGSIWALFVDPPHRGAATIQDVRSPDSTVSLAAAMKKAGFSEFDRPRPASRSGESQLLAKRRSSPRVRKRKEESHT
jgi:hypothetical protein